MTLTFIGRKAKLLDGVELPSDYFTQRRGAKGDRKKTLLTILTRIPPFSTTKPTKESKNAILVKAREETG